MSKGGRLTLIQSVLSSIPIYYMSLFKMPRVVAASLEKMMREFLWDRDSTGKGRSLVRWKTVCKPKELGGLGIGNLILRNKALLDKWLWRFPLEQHTLWAAVIRSKYGLDRNGWDTNRVTVGSFRNPWKFISQGISNLSSYTKWVSYIFKTSFPRLYQLSRKKFCVINQMYSVLPNNSLSWDFGFRRALNYREVDELMGFLPVIESVSLNLAANDVRCWASNSGVFSFKVSAWLIFLGRLNTCDRVQRRNPQMMLSPNRCVMCKKDEESANHLFLHCCSARFLWLKALGEVGLHWHYGIVWFFPFFGISGWRENTRIFDDKEMLLEDIFEKAKFSALQWAFSDKSFKGFPFSLVAFNWKDVIGIS
ncbi:hypothetical protein UlMin_009097 [Ulmus minor]